MRLREYQRKAVDAAVEDLRDVDSSLLVMATGLGKTVTFSHVAKRFAGDGSDGGRVMVLAHREELIRQAADKLARVTGEVPDVEMAEEWADKPCLTGRRARLVVSSIQTQVSGFGGRGRMSRFAPSEFSLVIVDEAHHAVADSYKRVLAHYRQNSDLKVLGVTATPDRADEEALGQVFERVSFVYEINDGIADGWLVPILQRSVTVQGLDFSAVRTMAGDLNGADLAALMEYEGNLHGIAHPTFEVAAGRKTLVFAASVAHAQRLCEIFNRHRADCARFVCGATDDLERRRTLKGYREGRFQFLVNVGVFTEGFDEPSIRVVAVARPTKSRALYTQMVGRGTRPLDGVVDGVDGAAGPLARVAAIRASGKPDLEVLDFVGNSGKHKLMTCAEILGGKYPDEVVEAAAQAAREGRGAVGLRKLLEEAAAEAERRRAEAEGRRAAEAATRAALVGRASYSTELVNAFDVLDLRPAVQRGWDKGKPASGKQVDLLRKFGVPGAAELSSAHACQLIGTLIERSRSKQCTFKQAKLLKRYGLDPNVSFDEARKTIDAIAANNWTLPSGFGAAAL